MSALEDTTEVHDRLVELDRLEGLRDAAKAAAVKTSGMNYVRCRTFGHTWSEVEADRNPKVGWYMKLRCDNCGTTRSDIVNRFGEIEGRSYKHPKDYRDTDRWKRSQWRMQYLRRLASE